MVQCTTCTTLDRVLAMSCDQPNFLPVGLGPVVAVAVKVEDYRV